MDIGLKGARTSNGSTEQAISQRRLNQYTPTPQHSEHTLLFQPMEAVAGHIVREIGLWHTRVGVVPPYEVQAAQSSLCRTEEAPTTKARYTTPHMVRASGMPQS